MVTDNLTLSKLAKRRTRSLPRVAHGVRRERLWVANEWDAGSREVAADDRSADASEGAAWVGRTCDARGRKLLRRNGLPELMDGWRTCEALGSGVASSGETLNAVLDH